MNMKLEWHKNSLKNRWSYYERQKVNLEKLQKEVERLCQENTFYQVQIHEAELQNKDSFDDEHFMSKYKHHYVIKEN